MQKNQSYRESREIGIYAFQKYRSLINNHIDNYTSHKLWVLLFYPHHKAYTVSCDLVTFTEEILNGKYLNSFTASYGGTWLFPQITCSMGKFSKLTLSHGKNTFLKKWAFSFAFHETAIPWDTSKGQFLHFFWEYMSPSQYNSHRMNLKVFCTNNIPLYRTKQLLKTSLRCYAS